MELLTNWLKRMNDPEFDLLAQRKAWAQQIADAEAEYEIRAAPLWKAERQAAENLAQVEKKRPR